MQFVYVKDLVTAMVRSMEEPRAVGEAFNIGDPKPLTQVELVEKLAQGGERRADAGARAARRDRPGRRQRHGASRYYFGEYYDLPPITENIGKVTRVLKMKLTPFETGPEGNLPVVHAQSQAADRGLRVRRQAAGDGADRIACERVGSVASGTSGASLRFVDAATRSSRAPVPHQTANNIRLQPSIFKSRFFKGSPPP